MPDLEKVSPNNFPLLVEVRIRPETQLKEDEIIKKVKEFLLNLPNAQNNRPIRVYNNESTIGTFVNKILISRSGCSEGQTLDITTENMEIIIYRTEQSSSIAQVLDDQTENCDETSVSSYQWELPNEEFDDLWENLIFDSNLKSEVIDYVNSMLLLADCHVDRSIVTVNRMVLFHGPPGTGKTTLCKALAQRLSVRMRKRFVRSIFVEVNSHSLFSKWFSESGKLVMKMFAQIAQLLEDPETLVFVLIDEVESLTMARQSAMNRNEPSDAVRVVNALLTQIDSIRKYPNVLILTTSNLSEAVDPAFVDRADIKRYIPLPSYTAIYSIYYGIIQELIKCGAIKDIIPMPNQLMPSWDKPLKCKSFTSLSLSSTLKSISKRSCRAGFSGRTLRKLPVLAFAKLLKKGVSTGDFLSALCNIVEDEIEDINKIAPITFRDIQDSEDEEDTDENSDQNDIDENTDNVNTIIEQ